MFQASNCRNLILLFLCAITLITCTKDLSLDLSSTGKKLIINGKFAANQKFTVQLSSSRNILDSDSKIEKISDAYVAIKNDEGKILGLLEESEKPGLYISSDSVKAYQGNTYHLEVTHPFWSGTVFTASSSAPEISSKSIIDTNHVIINNAPALKVGVLIHDLSISEDKYVFEVELKEKGVLAHLMIENAEDNDVQIYGDKMSPTRLFLGDAKFNGDEKNLDFFTTQGIPNDSNVVHENGITEIRMMNVSQELYDYYKSLEEYQLAQKTIGAGNSSAVRIYSNIKRSGVNNGLGIFAGYNLKSLTFAY